MLHRALTLTLLLQALPAVLPAAGIPVAGRILGPDGEPKAKAEVRLEAIPPTYERAVLRLHGKPGPDPVATTRTGADGTFEVAAPEAGMWKVVVSAPGVLAIECRLIPLVEAAVLPAVELTPAADLEVRLVDAEGKPRPGMVGGVALGIRDQAWRPQLRLGKAGEDGVAHLPLGRGEKIQLEVLAAGHPLDVFELWDETSVTITAKPGVAGTVRVVGRNKQPLAEAVAFQGSALLPLGLSDAEGRIPLVLQAKDPAALKVSAADRRNGSFEIDLAAAAGKVEDLRLDPPETVSGRVLDLTNRDPVAGALVWAVRGELVRTDKQGHYALDVGVYKSRWMQAAAAGYLKGQSSLQGVGSGEAPAIALAPAAALSGRVVDPEGGLLAGVALELEILPQSARLPHAVHRMMRDGWRGRTSRKGVFRVEGLPAKIGFRLKLSREGFAPRTLEIPPLEGFESRTGLEIVLEPGRLAFGRVVDADEVPIAAAEVALRTPPPADLMSARRMMGQFDESDAVPTRLTDAEGRFEIADLAPGRYDLEVRAAGFAPALVPGVRVSEEGGRVDFGTVIMVPGAAIEGRVTDPDGGAIAAAEVTVDFGSQNFIGVNRSDRPRGQTQTDAKGRFVVADLLPGQAVTLTVTKEAYGSHAVADLRPPTDEPLLIVLEPAGRLAGKVVDRQGEPIPRATVSANPDHRAVSSGSMVHRRRRSAWARTGADGRFLLEDVDPGTHQVTVQAEGYQHQMQSGIEVAAGNLRELEVVLEVGAVIEGSVTTTDGEPVVQASINVTEQQEGLLRGAWVSAAGETDVEGRYRVTSAPTGKATITVYHDNGQRLEKHIEVQPGANVVDLVLERGFEISGQVVAPDGTPVGGAAVSMQEIVQAGMVHYSSGSSEAVTAADGTFTLSGAKAGHYTVIAQREGYATARSENVEVAADVSGLLLELRRGATLKGRVLGLELDELGSLSLVAYGQGGMRQGRVDFSAEYAVDSLAPGQWHIQAQVAGSGRSAALQVEVPEGATEVEQDIEFGTGFTLTGIVIDNGRPLAGVNVAAGGSSGSSGHGRTGSDGRFRIENLKAGTYQVMVMAGMGPQHMEALELAGDHDLEIEISTGSLSGLVRGVDGEPLAGVSVALEQLEAEGNPIWGRRLNFGNMTQSDSRGRFHIPQLRQGGWRVVATKSGYAPGETTVTVAGGSAPEVEIRMTPTEGVSFELVLESGAAVQAVQVGLLDPSGRQIAASSYAVVDGRVRVSMVPPGRWELLVQAFGSAATRFPVTSPGDQGRLVLPIGGTLSIKVPELEKVPIAVVELKGPDGKPFLAPGTGLTVGPGEWLMSGGQSMVPGLTPGVWTFTVQHDGHTWSGSATVTPGGTTEVSLP